MSGTYDIKWLLYVIISFALTAAILLILHFTVKKESTKENWVKIFGILTLFSHISVYYYKYIFLREPANDAGISTFFPIYPCNVAMMLFPFVYLFNGKARTFLLEFLAYYGVFGGIITMFEPSSFYRGGDILYWPTLKSFLSHSFLLLTSLYCFTSGIVKIRINNLFSFIGGVSGIFLPTGLLMNYILLKAGYDPNAMYLRYLPLEGVPILSPYMITFLMILVILGFITLWDRFAKPEEERWYVILKNKISTWQGKLKQS